MYEWSEIHISLCSVGMQKNTQKSLKRKTEYRSDLFPKRNQLSIFPHSNIFTSVLSGAGSFLSVICFSLSVVVTRLTHLAPAIPALLGCLTYLLTISLCLRRLCSLVLNWLLKCSAISFFRVRPQITFQGLVFDNASLENASKGTNHDHI